MQQIEDAFDLEDPSVNIQEVFEFINKNGLSDKIKIPKTDDL